MQFSWLEDVVFVLCNSWTARAAAHPPKAEPLLQCRAAGRQLSAHSPIPVAPAELWGCPGRVFIVALSLQVQGQPLMVQVSGGQLITSTGQPIMVQAVPGGQGQTIMQVPVSGTQGLQQTQQQIAVQGQQVAQAAEGQTIVYQPVNADGTILQQGMITIPAASLAGAQIVQTGANTNTTSSGQGTVTVTLPVAGNVVNSGGMVMMVPGAGSVPAIQRIPLPGAEMLEEEPLYVNAKQYHRILKRRQARAKLEAEGKIPKERRVRIKLRFNLGLLCEKGTESHLGWKMRVGVLVFLRFTVVLVLFVSYIRVNFFLSALRIVLLAWEFLGVSGVVCECALTVSREFMGRGWVGSGNFLWRGSGWEFVGQGIDGEWEFPLERLSGSLWDKGWIGSGNFLWRGSDWEFVGQGMDGDWEFALDQQ
uniref:Nuclear transcription factor Y subunit n=1 Tax=Ficedula albicollis TaxID=59894 RepID=A0A803VS33_FICAL